MSLFFVITITDWDLTKNGMEKRYICRQLFVKFHMVMVCIPLVCCFAPSGQTGQCLVRADAEDPQKTAHELRLIFF